MAGDFFKEKDEKDEKKKEELIEDYDVLVSTYNFENQKYQTNYDLAYEFILPIRGKLRGGSDPQNIGLLNELRKHLQMSKIAGMPIGQKMYIIIDDAETLDNQSERYAEYLEGNIEVYQFLCKSSIKIIENLYDMMDKMGERIEEKEKPLRERELTEERKQYLQEEFNKCKIGREFGTLVRKKEFN